MRGISVDLFVFLWYNKVYVALRVSTNGQDRQESCLVVMSGNDSGMTDDVDGLWLMQGMNEWYKHEKSVDLWDGQCRE
jgi:hypothetical protein